MDQSDRWLDLLIGNWLSGFFDVARQAADSCQAPIYEGSTLALRLALSLLLLGALSVIWFRQLRKQVEPNMGFLLSLGVAVTLLVTPFIHHYDLVLTLLPLLYGLSLLSHTKGRASMALKALYWGTLLIVPWVLWVLAPEHMEKSVQLWLIPLIVLALLIAPLMIQRRKQETQDPLSQ